MKGVGCPTGLTVAEQMQLAADDGVDLLVVVNQNGAQNSNSTIGIVYDDVKAFLQSPPGQRWNTTIIGVSWLILRMEIGCNCFVGVQVLMIILRVMSLIALLFSTRRCWL